MVNTDEKFTEFETIHLGEPEKAKSKIILRDVAREKVDIEVKRPTKIVKEEIKPEEKPRVISTRKEEKKPEPVVKLSAKEIKDREIEKAVKTASKFPMETPKKKRGVGLGWKRAVLITGCMATISFAVAYFINLASTDMSIQVAAMQSGIQATYPTYVPRDYKLSDVTSASGKVTIHFKKGTDGFGITEEETTWDSDALLNNYVKMTYGNDYSMIVEQGLTLYMGDNWEAWVNGGMLYKLFIDSGTLTKKQMKSIATSL
jgi:hypothetical protein